MPEISEYKERVTGYTVGYNVPKGCIRVYGESVSMEFDVEDERLPSDLKENFEAYLLCARRFEPKKKQSNTGLTSVWFELMKQETTP